MLVWFDFQQKHPVGLFLPVQAGFDVDGQVLSARVFEPSDQQVGRGGTRARFLLLGFPPDRLQHTRSIGQILAQSFAQVLRLQAVLEAVVGEIQHDAIPFGGCQTKPSPKALHKEGARRCGPGHDDTLDLGKVEALGQHQGVGEHLE